MGPADGAAAARILADLARLADPAPSEVSGYGPHAWLPLEGVAGSSATVAAVDLGAVVVVRPPGREPDEPAAPVALSDLAAPGPADPPPEHLPADLLETWRMWQRQQAAWQAAHERHRRTRAVLDWLTVASEHVASNPTLELLTVGGLLTVDGAQPLRRHLLVAPARINIDSSGELTVTSEAAAIDDTLPDIDLDDEQAATLERACTHLAGELQRLRPNGVDVAASDTLLGVYGTLADQLGADADVEAAPGLLIRRRRRRTERALDRLAASDQQPHPLDRALNRDNVEGRTHATVPDRQLALPATPSQRQAIAAAYAGRDLTLSGPAGTGKTHTVANIAAALGDADRRVLIVADSTSALTQIRDRMPAQIRDIIPIEAGDHSDLAGPLSEIAAISNLDESVAAAGDLLRDAEHAWEDAARGVLDARSRETGEISLLGATMTLAGHWRALDDLNGEESVVADHDPHLYVAADAEPPLSDDDMGYLLALTRHQQTHAGQAPDDGPLPDPPTLPDVAAALQQRAQTLADLTREPTALERAVAGLPPADLGNLQEAAHQQLTRPALPEGLPDDLDLDPDRLDTRPVTIDTSLFDDIDRVLHATAEDTRPLDDIFAPAEEPDPNIAELVAAAHQPLLAHLRQSVALRNADPAELHRLSAALQDAADAAQRQPLAARCLQESAVSGDTAVWRRRQQDLQRALEQAEGQRSRHRIHTGGVRLGDLVEEIDGMVGGWAAGGMRRRRAERSAAALLEPVKVNESPVANVEHLAAVAAEASAHRTLTGALSGWASIPAGDPFRAASELEGALSAVLDLADLFARDPLMAAIDIPTERRGNPKLLAATATASRAAALLQGTGQPVDPQDRAAWQRIADRVRIDGRAPVSRTELAAAYETVQTRHRLAETLGCGPDDVDRFLDVARQAQQADRSDRAWQAATDGLPGHPDPQEILDLIGNLDTVRGAVDSSARLDRWVSELAGEGAFGARLSATLAAGDLAGYRDALDDLATARHWQDAARARAELSARLATTNPGLAAAIDRDPDDPALTAWLPDRFGRLWRAAARRSHLYATPSVDLQPATATLSAAEARLAHAATDMLCANVRRHTARAFSAAEHDPIPTWLDTHQPDSLAACRAAARIWMATVETAGRYFVEDDTQVRFDAVIVDEASRLPVSDLFLYALAPQVIIVGDPQQTSRRSDLTWPQDPPEPLNRLDADASLFDFAAARNGTAGTRHLTDQFRSVPDLVAVVNAVGYAPSGQQLTPLRAAADAPVRPATIRRHTAAQTTSDGIVDEIEQVVATVVACHADPAYDHATFAVGALYAPSGYLSRIRDELHRHIGPSDLAGRRLIVGTAADLRGLERDVVVAGLGLAADQRPAAVRRNPDTGSAPIADAAAVLVARARNQFWLIHTIDMDAFPQGDVRSDLLATLDNPPAWAVRDDPPVVNPLYRMLTAELRKQGYTVVVDRTVLGATLPLTIDHAGRTVAVSIDGSGSVADLAALHTERVREHTLRQLGWRFLRIGASEVRRDLARAAARIGEELQVGR